MGIICQRYFRFRIFVEVNRERETPPLVNLLKQIFKRQLLLGGHFSMAVGSIVADIPIMLKLDMSIYLAMLNHIQQLV